MVAYKVVEIKHKSIFKGRMTAKDLEKAINENAAGGWPLDRIVSGETASFVGGKDVFLLIFRHAGEPVASPDAIPPPPR